LAPRIERERPRLPSLTASGFDRASIWPSIEVP
jgi:hypothetical protein